MAFNYIVKRISVFVVFLSILSSACTRVNNSELGLGLLPSLDAINTKDTVIDVETETVDIPDSLIVYGSDNQILGEINNDPQFGTTKATMFFQMLPDFFPYFIQGSKDSIIVDSAVLTLKYAGFYGDTSKPIKINLHQIDPSTPLDISKYYPANFPEFYGIQSGVAMANPVTINLARIGDSIINRYEASQFQIRIKLFDKYARMFIKEFDSNNAYRSDTTLRKFFPGFALSVDPSANNNGLLRFNMLDTNTKLALYYKTNYSSTGLVGKVDTTVVKMRFRLSANGYANFIKRDRTGSEVSRHFGKANDSLVFVQTSPGTGVKIKIPALKSFTNRIIHRAELIAEQVPDDATLNTIETQMLAPKYLLLAAYDANSSKVLRSVPNDYQTIANSEAFVRFGGFQTIKALNGYNSVASYNFNITRYVQGVISRKDSTFDFRISAPVNDSIRYIPPYPNNTIAGVEYITTSTANQPAIGRVRLGGGKHSRFRMRLRIYYSDL
jgi:hypothetical protein